MYISELEIVSFFCFRVLDGFNYDVRCVVVKFLGNLMLII